MNIFKAILRIPEIIGEAIIDLAKSVFTSNNGKKTNTSAPKLKPFSNAVTGPILGFVLGMIGLGITLILFENFAGVIIASIGAAIWFLGDTKIPTVPRTAMALTWWGSFIEIGGKPVVVGGRTILANYWPFYLYGETFDITDVDKDFPVTVLSSNKVPLRGIVSVTLKPNLHDAVDYLQAGKMPNIILQLDDMIINEARTEASKHTDENLTRNGDLVARPLRTSMDNLFEEKSLGVERTKTKANFDLPQEILDAMQQKAIEGHEREGEFAEYDTDMMAAEKLQQRYLADKSMKEKVPTLQECLEQIKTLRLVRDERVARIETTGPGGIVNLVDTNLDMGPGRDKKRRKNRGKKGDE